MPASLTPEQIELRTQRLGQEMFERIRGRQAWVLSKEWWLERLLNLCMVNEWFKVQSFRFIDALPMLSDDVELARHLREYFVLPEHSRQRRENGQHGPSPAREWFVRGASRWMNWQRPDSFRARQTARFARAASIAMAGNFIAGSNVEEALRTIRTLRERKLAFTIDVLGEAALSRAEAEAYHGTYMDLIDQLPGHAASWPAVPLIDEVPPVNVSVKLTSLHPGFDAIAPEAAKRRVKELMRPLLRKAMSGGVFIHVDMEQYAIKDLTLELFEELFMEDEFRDYPHVGIVLQAYLKDTDQDIPRAIEYAKKRGTPFWVRLVKGAYWDSETVWADQEHWPWPVWEQKWQSDACYERCTQLLVENHRHIHSAFASHNIRSLAHAIALRELYEAPATAFELQMLYGMGDPIKRAVVDMGQRCRIYTPYGPLLAGMAYFIRRLLENTANESFLRRTADTPAAELLRDPQETGRRTPAFKKPTIVRYEFEEPLMNSFENVPNTDFSREPNRRQMTAALEQARAALGRDIPLLINGERVTTGQWKESLNPSRPKEVVARVAQADAAAVDRAVKAAAEAFTSWRRVPPDERAQALFRLAGVMEKRRFELAAWQALECGKPWREADADVSEAIDYCNYYGKEMVRLAARPRSRAIPGEQNEYFYAPRGVVAVISPWNFPLAIPAGLIAASVVTGNTVVFKPAGPAEVVGAKLAEMCGEAGIPGGVVNFVAGPGSAVGELLVKHPQVMTVAFTGSREVGLRIYRLIAEAPAARPALKRFIPEMGGKNAIIIDSDADLDESIKAVMHGAFGYAGQKCSACSRVIVLDAAHDRFMERLIESVRSAGVGPADNPATSIPPVIDRKAFDSIRGYIEQGKKEARCVLEVDASGPTKEHGGYYIGPVIFDDVPPQSRIAQEEIFGPVLAVIRAHSIEEAIEIFNGTDYALTGGIFSRSPGNIEKARAECECGNFYINRKVTGSRPDLQPFGGLKMSGFGARVGGPDYLVQFCDPRTVTENTLRRGFAPSKEVVETLG